MEFVFSHNGNAAAELERVCADRSPLIVLHIARAEIELGAVGSACDRLMHLSESARFTLQLEGSVCIFVDGYNDDPRELHEIPAVVAYFRALTREWPYWAHFAARFDDTIGLLLRLLMDVVVIGRKGTFATTAFKDPSQLQEILLHLFEGMNRLHEYHGLEASHTMKSSDEFLAAINRLLDANPES